MSDSRCPSSRTHPSRYQTNPRRPHEGHRPDSRAHMVLLKKSLKRRPGGEERDSRELYSLSTLSVTRRAHDQAVLRSERGGRSIYTPNARPRTRPNPMTRQSRGRSCCAIMEVRRWLWFVTTRPSLSRYRVEEAVLCPHWPEAQYGGGGWPEFPPNGARFFCRPERIGAARCEGRGTGASD